MAALAKLHNMCMLTRCPFRMCMCVQAHRCKTVAVHLEPTVESLLTAPRCASALGHVQWGQRSILVSICFDVHWTDMDGACRTWSLDCVVGGPISGRVCDCRAKNHRFIFRSGKKATTVSVVNFICFITFLQFNILCVWMLNYLL